MTFSHRSALMYRSEVFGSTRLSRYPAHIRKCVCHAARDPMTYDMSVVWFVPE